MTDIGTRARSAACNRNTVAVAVLLVLALIYPLIVDSLISLPLIGDFVPKTDSMVVMVAFTTMAIGLNMVVGYAGLLDLGYVAFYAVGAYTAGWFASQQFDQVSINVGAVGIPDGFPASTSRCGSCCPIAGLLTMLAGIAIGLPTLRLRGDYLAIVTLGFGEIVPQFVRNGDNVVRLRPHARDVRDHPDRLARFRRHRRQARPARELPPVVRAVAVVLLDRGRDPADHRLLQRAVARLAARPRLDRDPRGRDRGRARWACR